MTEAPAAWLARLAGELPGPLAHDLNNILAVLTGGLDLLEPRLAADPLAGARLLRLHRALDRARALTGAMQALAATDRATPLPRLLPSLRPRLRSRLRPTHKKSPRLAARVTDMPVPAPSCADAPNRPLAHRK